MMIQQSRCGCLWALMNGERTDKGTQTWERSSPDGRTQQGFGDGALWVRLQWQARIPWWGCPVGRATFRYRRVITSWQEQGTCQGLEGSGLQFPGVCKAIGAGAGWDEPAKKLYFICWVIQPRNYDDEFLLWGVRLEDEKGCVDGHTGAEDKVSQGKGSALLEWWNDSRICHLLYAQVTLAIMRGACSVWDGLVITHPREVRKCLEKKKKCFQTLSPMNRVREEVGVERGHPRSVQAQEAHSIRGNQQAQPLPIVTVADQKDLGSVKLAGCGMDIRSQDTRAAKGSGESSWRLVTEMYFQIIASETIKWQPHPWSGHESEEEHGAQLVQSQDFLWLSRIALRVMDRPRAWLQTPPSSTSFSWWNTSLPEASFTGLCEDPDMLWHLSPPPSCWLGDMTFTASSAIWASGNTTVCLGCKEFQLSSATDFTVTGSKYTFENTAVVRNTSRSNYTEKSDTAGRSHCSSFNLTFKGGKTCYKHRNWSLY